MLIKQFSKYFTMLKNIGKKLLNAVLDNTTTIIFKIITLTITSQVSKKSMASLGSYFLAYHLCLPSWAVNTALKHSLFMLNNSGLKFELFSCCLKTWI